MNGSASFAALKDGSRAHYARRHAKHGIASETLLLLHGSNGSLQSWDALVRYLPEDLDIITLDLPGHGLTQVPRGIGASVPEMQRFVSSFISAVALSDGFVLGGHSMGAHISWRFALDCPGRASKLVLIAPGGIASPLGPQAAASRLARNPIGSVFLSLLWSPRRVRSGLAAVFHQKSAVTPAMVVRVWRLGKRPGAGRLRRSRLLAPAFEPSAVNRLSEVDVPTLLLWGQQDAVFPIALASAFTSAMPSVGLISYPECGHFPMEELPMRCSEDIAAFLGCLSPDWKSVLQTVIPPRCA